jgi:3-phenylpropionate/trans-cinnamate dioxygenase ferredoxin component
MSEFFVAGRLSEIADGQMMLTEVDDRLVILFRKGDQVYCMDDVCTHDGGSLSDGDLDGQQIECPRHGARFNLCTGEALTMPATEDNKMHNVKIENDEILVSINES